MQDDVFPIKVICKGGLSTNENFLELSDVNPGAAVNLINYETSLFGGYRRINGFRPLNEDHPGIDDEDYEGKVLGIVVHQNTIYSARANKADSNYTIFRNDSNGWNPVSTGLTLSEGGVNKIRSDVITLGGTTFLICADGGNPAWGYDGTDWFQLLFTNNGGDAEPGGDQLPVSDPSHVTVFKNHVFVASQDIIAHSAPNDPLTWTTATGAGQLLPGFTVVAMKPFRDELYVFGQSKIKKIVVDNGGNFVFKDVSTNMGCIAPDSVIEIGGNLIFLSPDGIRPVAGTARIDDIELALLSRDIQYLCTSLASSVDLNLLNSVVIRNKTQFRYFFSDTNTPESQSRGIIGSLRKENDPQQNGWEFGELVGIKTACTWSGYIGGQEYILHGDFEGRIFRQELGSNFNGSPITAVYSMPYLDFGQATVRKTARTLRTFIRSEGNLELSIGVKYDWESPIAINPANYVEISQNAQSFYDDVTTIYDDPSTVYGGPSQPIFKTNVQGSAYSMQVTYFTSGDIAPYTIQGVVIEGTPRGRQ